MWYKLLIAAGVSNMGGAVVHLYSQLVCSPPPHIHLQWAIAAGVMAVACFQIAALMGEGLK